MKKLIFATVMMMMMGTAVFAAEQTAANQAQQPDPLVSALNNLVDNLSASETPTIDGNAASAKGRSKKDSAVVVGTAAAIGSAIGAMIAKDDRAKGAAIGAAVGGIAGLIYDRMQAKKADHPNTTVVEAPQTVSAEPEKKIL